MQKDEASLDRLIENLQREKSAGSPPNPPPPLNFGGGGDRFDPMEPRVAKLEAQVEHIGADLAKLAALPVDVATIKERLQHLPTKDEVKVSIEMAIDRLGTRVQRQIAIAGSLVTIILGAITIGSKLL